MRLTRSTCAQLLLSAVLLAVPASSQPRMVTVRGELQTGQPFNFIQQDCYVELSSAGDRNSHERSLVNRDGSFSFLNLQPGSYQLRVLDLHGESLH